MHLTSLPGPSGIGEIGESALKFVDALASMNLAVWQFLPMGPTGYGDSPYQELSTFAGNEMLIDTTDLVRMNLLPTNAADRLHGLPQEYVDYGKLIPIKHALLASAASRFDAAASSSVKAEFDDFLDHNDRIWLHDYAMFRVLKDRHGSKPWPAWEQSFARRERTALKKLQNDSQPDIQSWKIRQFLFARQWRALRKHASENGVTLFGDMPIYISLDSADAWSNPEILRISGRGQLKHVAGVPPDYFSRKGQLWGNPLYDWEQLAKERFSWWIDRMRHAISLFDLVRIDHFRGFESFWSVRAGAKTTRRGRWEPGPREKLFDAMCNALGQLPIVAEDLGVLTPAVDALRDRYSIPGMKVLQFEIMQEDFDIAAIRENCACYTGTHDNDTTSSWFRSGCGVVRGKRKIARAQQAVLDMTGGSADAIHLDLVRLAFTSKAILAIAPMQDFLGLGTEARLNRPGTTKNNWRWRLGADQLTPRLRETLGELAASSGRAA